MNDWLNLIVGVVGIFVALSGAAYFLQPSAMKKNGFFTTPPVAAVKIVAFLFGMIFLAIFVFEFLGSTTLHIVPPVMAALLFTYSYGAERIIQAWENRQKK